MRSRVRSSAVEQHTRLRALPADLSSPRTCSSPLGSAAGRRRSTAAGKDTGTDIAIGGADGVPRHRKAPGNVLDGIGRAAEKGTVNCHAGAARAGERAREFVQGGRARDTPRIGPPIEARDRYGGARGEVDIGLEVSGRHVLIVRRLEG